jgi:hypothetical protein
MTVPSQLAGDDSVPSLGDLCALALEKRVQLNGFVEDEPVLSQITRSVSESVQFNVTHGVQTVLFNKAHTKYQGHP